MDMDFAVKKTLSTPIKHFISCISGGEENDGCPRRGSRKAMESKGMNALNGTKQKAMTVDQMRSCQANLEKERKLRAAKNAQKNAERAATRAHFRSKYQLSENLKDTNHLKVVGGNVALPHDLAAIVQPEDSAQDEEDNLFGAIQALSLNLGMPPTGMRMPIPGAKQCRVM